MAVTLTALQLAYELRLIADTTTALEEPQAGVITRTLGAATALVEDYAPTAPEAVQNEAVARLAGFLYDTPPGSARAFTNALDQSGATALLGSYRVRRATPLSEKKDIVNGLRELGRATLTLAANTWAGTSIQAPSGPAFGYQLLIGAKSTALLIVTRAALSETVAAGEVVNVGNDYAVGLSSSGEIMLTGIPGQLTIIVWGVSGWA